MNYPKSRLRRLRYNKNIRSEIDGSKICGKLKLGHSEHL